MSNDNKNAPSVLSNAFGWGAAYLLLISAPLLLLLLGEVPPGGGFWWDFAMALGFGGMAIMGVQFALTARFRRAAAPFGMDILYYFHRLVALLGVALILAHFGVLRVLYPEALGALDPREASAHMSAGRLALLLFLVLIVSSLWRKPLRLEYSTWRIMHAALATTAFLLAVVHITGVGYYTEALQKWWLWTGYTLFWALLIVYVRVLKPWRALRRPWKVAEVRPERGAAWTLALEPEGHAGIRHKPGQFGWLTLRSTPFRFQEHPFSFSGSAERSGRVEFTIKALGDFTRSIGDVQPGERAYLDAPFGVFSPDRHPDAPGYVFIAGGVGIAPIMGMLRTLADRGERRPLFLIYANKDWEGVIFREELDELTARLELCLVHVLTDPPRGWDGEHGYVDGALLERVLPPESRDYEYFLCGPMPMTAGVRRALAARGVLPTRIHAELFNMV
ncbi:ferric reductase-like transmembrane domain-containing protein [Ectothiorhodospiraceae bacterium 2226]|nr:ferric reductase-like transmembrane domain-containing protein [Ectothiorhodospiraceae bacterium 2226]